MKEGEEIINVHHTFKYNNNREETRREEIKGSAAPAADPAEWPPFLSLRKD